MRAGPAADRPRFPEPPYRAEVEDLVLPDDTPTALREIAANLGEAPSTILLAVFTLVLHRHTGEGETVVGVRGGPALRVEVDPDAPFADLARRVAGAGRADTAASVLFGNDLAEAPQPGAELELTADGTAIRVTYHANLFDRATAARLAAHYRTALSEVLHDPHTPVAAVPVEAGPPQSPPAWRLAIPAGYAPPPPAGADESLVDRFRAVAAAEPARTAVTGPSGAYRYDELDAVTDALAADLCRRFGPGRRIAVLAGHDVGLAVGVWSVLKAGCAYVPLDPRQPAGRLDNVLADTDVAAVLHDPDLRTAAAALGDDRTPLVPLPSAAKKSEPGPEVSADSPAYLLNTSGSTGRPKAVVQIHRNVLAHALAYADRIRLGPTEQVPLLARFTFDAAVMDLFGALLTGATLHIVDPMLPPAELRARLAAVGATILHGTPTLFRYLMGDGDDGDLRSVRVVVLGGEEVVRDDVERFREHFPADCTLVNGLGPTECTLALQHLVTEADADGAAVPVGHPVDGVEVCLLDPGGRPTEVVGELEIRSGRVASGYWRQEKPTAGAFGTHPDGTRYYRTGDLVRRRPDGALVFQGRKDRQVKIRGHRLELGEVEALLRTHPTVAQATVVVDQRRGGARLAGYVTSATSLPADAGELAGYLTRQLPDYAVPSALMVLDSMPLTATGKLDRSRLPVPETVLPADDDRPRTPVEVTLAQIWCRLLGIAEVGVRTSFLAAGGDSIRLMEMFSEVKREFSVEIPLVRFLTSPTVSTIVGLIEDRHGGTNDTPTHRQRLQ
ncbi:amino acid adenylation domain-containing protein [Micromonospora sp. LOL_024]|uniref:amino acid adenylation domain-containing protein n=1 Tax=Micromonospora sp. LOL_024 TaxID=3345412 RepID=UPI003A8415AB